MKMGKILLLVLVFAFGHIQPVFGQKIVEPIGETMSVNVAMDRFGGSVDSVGVDAALIESLLLTAREHLVFGLINGHAIAYSGMRVPLVVDNTFVSRKEIMHVYSTEMVRQLIGTSPKGMVYFQNRKTVFTLQYENTVLEVGELCPPLCIE